MKGFITKIISILVIAMMIINSSLLTIISVAIDEADKIIDESKIDANYELNIRKYVNYQVGEEKGLMVQTYLKDGIEYQEGQEQVPIKSTNVVINAPKVNGEYPRKVEVVVDSTRLTNGEPNGKDVNYSYNNEIGELTIITENKADEKGNVYSEYSVEDKNEYKLNFYYSANCYDDKNIKKTLEFTGKVEFTLTKDKDFTVSKDILQNFEVSENVSGLVSTEVTTSDIYNGYIESNVANGTTYRTEYTENVGIDVDYKEISDEIVISENDYFVKNDKEIETEDIVYKSTKINKNDVLSKLGGNGTLKITNESGEVLAEINKDTEAKEDGSVEITYKNEVKSINVNMSKPVSLGRILIENTKQIKETMKDANVTKIKTKNTISCVNNVKETTKTVDEVTKEEKEVEAVKKEEVYTYTSTNLAEIKATKTDVKVIANNTNWTNNVQNEVTFTTTLVTSGAEYNLFKNPIINIKLPQEVEKVILGNVSLLYDENLKIKSTNIEEINGCKVIKIEIDGTQNSYALNSMIEGANVIIPTIVIAKKNINSVDTSVEFNCYNSDNTNTSEKVDVKINSISGNSNDELVNAQALNYEQAVRSVEEIKASDISVTSTAQVGNQTLKTGDTVYEEQVIKYTVKITNNSNQTVSGIKVVGKIPEGTTYATINRGSYYAEKYEYIKDETVKEYTFENINILNPGEEKEESYEVVVNNLGNDETEKEIKNQIQTIVNDNTYQNDELINIAKQAELSVDLKSYIGRDTENSFYYDLFVENLTDHEINNVVVTTSEFQKEMTYKIENLAIDENHEISNMYFENRILKFNIDSIEPGGKANVKFNLITENFDDKINECLIKMVAKAQVGDGILYLSNENIRTAYPQYVTVTKSSDKEGEVLSYGDEIEYEINVKNESKVRTYVSIKDYLPNELNGISAEYETYVITGNENLSTEYDIEAEKNLNCLKNKVIVDLSYKVVDKADIDIKVLIPAGKTFTIKIKAKASYVSQRTEISNSAIVFGEYITTTASNIVKSYIVPVDDKENPDSPDPDNPNPDSPDPDNPNPDNPNPDNTNKKYSISGLAWIDNNKNGQRDNGEKLLDGVTVKLYNANTNAIVKEENGNNKVTATGENGQYSFTELVKGNYLVLFEYNTLEYDLTSYKASEVSEKENSDVVLRNVSIDGQEKNVALTDILKITNANLENIDMGVVQKEKFDLSLNKSITNVVLKYGNEENEYKYDESKLVKVEVPAKKILGATVSVEYQLEVKNEGNVDGYVDEIVDYLPEDFIFETDKNSGWTQKDSGILINTSLLGTIIKPGESKKIKLYLTRKITSDKMGISTNTAEIQKSNSINGSKDIDSINGNKNEAEDDYSQAQLIISIKTGLLRNITIIIVILAALIIMAYIIKTKKIKSFMIMIFMMVISTGFVANQVFALNIWIGSKNSDGSFVFKSDDEYSRFICLCRFRISSMWKGITLLYMVWTNKNWWYNNRTIYK